MYTTIIIGKSQVTKIANTKNLWYLWTSIIFSDLRYFLADNILIIYL